MSSSSIPTAVDMSTVVNAALLNSYRDAISQLERGASPVPRVAFAVTQIGHGFGEGNWLRLQSNGTFTRAQANNDGNARGVCGVVSRVLTGDSFELTLLGFVSGLQGLSPGPNYLAVSSPGAVQSSKPSSGNPIVPCIVAVSPSSGYVCVGGLDPNLASPLPPANLGDLLAGNNANSWASLSSSGALDGDVLTRDHTASPFMLKWAPVDRFPGGATRGSMMAHDNASSWGTVTPTGNNQILAADDTQGFGVKFAALSGLATSTQKATYAALGTDADRIAYLAGYLGLV